MAVIAYAGEEIVAYHNKGETDYLLVTFSELHHERMGPGYYFAKPLVEKADISCIGVINTVKGFYLSPEMENVRRLVDEVRGDRKLILFGQSMGGYAAIRYSAAFRADFVIACSPFYSMDPDELELPSDRHRQIFRQSMAHHEVEMRPEFTGMGLRDRDCAGRIVSLYDPFDSVDQYDCDLLRKHLPGVEFQTVPLASHEIFNGSWTTQMLTRIMLAIQSDDRAAFARELARTRRDTSQFILRTLRKAAYQKPEMCVRLFHAPRVTRNVDFRTMLADPVNMTLIHRLFARGRRTMAAQHFAYVAKEVLQLDFSGAGTEDGPILETTLARKLCLLMSQHGSFLAYTMATRRVSLDRNVFKRHDVVPVYAKWADGRATFYIRSDSQDIPISLASADPAMTAPELVPHGGHCVAIRGGDRYLGVRDNGELIVGPELGDAQAFVPLPIADQASAVKAGAINWFDQAVMSQAPDALPFSNEVAQTRQKTGRWRKLFARG